MSLYPPVLLGQEMNTRGIKKFRECGIESDASSFSCCSASSCSRHPLYSCWRNLFISWRDIFELSDFAMFSPGSCARRRFTAARDNYGLTFEVGEFHPWINLHFLLILLLFKIYRDIYSRNLSFLLKIEVKAAQDNPPWRKEDTLMTWIQRLPNLRPPDSMLIQ